MGMDGGLMSRCFNEHVLSMGRDCMKHEKWTDWTFDMA
jgi:hypothetical protein